MNIIDLVKPALKELMELLIIDVLWKFIVKIFRVISNIFKWKRDANDE